LTSAAIVLAAGRAARMGVPKARLFVGEQRALDRVLAASAAAERTILVMNPSLPGPTPIGDDRLTVATNEHPERGPLSSIQIALASETRPVDHYLLFPVDYALVERDVAAQVLAAASDRRARVLIPTYRGRSGHPVAFAGALASELRALGPGRTARDVLLRDERQITRLEVPHESVHIDMDTPFDYGRVDALARRREIEARLRGGVTRRIALGRTGGVLSQDRHPVPGGLAFARMKLDGDLSEEWQVGDERESAAAIFLPVLATAFLITAGPRTLPALSGLLARAGCRELIAPSMESVDHLAAGTSPPWRAFPEANGWRRALDPAGC
jgi:CTP:molybdopterin cytidylyltransferase MocA